jgi:hypothetical protein
VGSSWKGIAVMKSLPLSVANPKTASQVGRRAQFTTATKLGSTLLASTIKPLRDRFAQGQSGYNTFVSDIIESVGGNGVLDPANLAISKGSLLGNSAITVTYDTSDDEFTVDWSDNAGEGNALASDKVYFCVIDSTGKVYTQGDTLAIRTEVQDKKNNDLPTAPPSGAWGFISFLRADGTMVSDSVGAEITIIA